MYYKLCSISSDSLEALERMHWITPNDMKTSSSTKLGNSTTSPPSPPPNRTQFTTSSTQLTSSRLPPSAHRRPAPCAKPSGTPTQLALRPVIRRQPPGAQMVRLTPYRPAPATSRILAPPIARNTISALCRGHPPRTDNYPTQLRGTTVLPPSVRNIEPYHSLLTYRGSDHGQVETCSYGSTLQYSLGLCWYVLNQVESCPHGASCD
jgi:hypothetical protein